MYLHEISIEIKSKAKKEVVLNEFSLLIGAYRQSGQAINQNENVYWDGDRLFCHLKTIEKDALAAKYNNIYVSNNISKLEGLCKSTLQFRIAGNENENKVCKCKSPKSYVLFTHLFNDASPIECGKCAKPVPLYRLPYYDDNSYYSILSWEYNYKACDQL